MPIGPKSNPYCYGDIIVTDDATLFIACLIRLIFLSTTLYWETSGKHKTYRSILGCYLFWGERICISVYGHRQVSTFSFLHYSSKHMIQDNVIKRLLALNWLGLGFRLKVYWNLLPRVQWKLFQHYSYNGSTPNRRQVIIWKMKVILLTYVFVTPPQCVDMTSLSWGLLS